MCRYPSPEPAFQICLKHEKLESKMATARRSEPATMGMAFNLLCTFFPGNSGGLGLMTRKVPYFFKKIKRMFSKDLAFGGREFCQEVDI